MPERALEAHGQKNPDRGYPLWRRLALPSRIRSWSLTSLQQRLVKTGGRLVPHSGMRAMIGFCWPRESPRRQSEAVRQHAEKDRGVAAAGRLANQDRKQTSARKPSSGEVSAARQTGAGKPSTAAPQNGQSEPVAAATHPTVAKAM